MASYWRRRTIANDQFVKFAQLARNVLLPHQLKELKLAVARLQVRAHGPLTDIRHGDLKKELGLSDSDVESLNQAAVGARKFLYEKSLEARYEVIER